MKAFVAITDWDWFSFLASRVPAVDEVNFWQPGGQRVFRAIRPNDLFLFKLRSPSNAIVGGGIFAQALIVPLSLAWDAFKERNGAATLEEMRARIGRLRRVHVDEHEDYDIGCILLEQPFFLPKTEWIQGPRDWSRQIVSGKTYDLSQGEGRRIWQELVARVPGALGHVDSSVEPMLVAERYGAPRTVLPRLGQGSFRVIVTDLYERRCAVTHERTLPVLQAAHIRPFAKEGPNHPRNGLLLRSDLHTLFDRGYVTVTQDFRFEVSLRIKAEFENGRDYYALHGRELRLPKRREWAPEPEYLDWHASHVFRG
jgi:putative restriction endonuclease